MTIQEAIKSGKPFRKTETLKYPGDFSTRWFVMTDEGELVYLVNGAKHNPTKSEILTDDWEVKP